MRNNRFLLIIIAVVVAVGALQTHRRDRDDDRPAAGRQQVETERPRSDASAADPLERAYLARASNAQIEGQGVVERTLSDDNSGSRHQRFILRLASGRTLLIAHNIDLAPRVEGLRAGDTVRFFGEYEWNDKGGVLHWTHSDPERRHVAGWIMHEGKVYQ